MSFNHNIQLLRSWSYQDEEGKTHVIVVDETWGRKYFRDWCRTCGTSFWDVDHD